MPDITKEIEKDSGKETGAGYNVIGVRFKPAGKVYNFNVGEMEPEPGTWVVVESEMGLSVGLVVKPRYRIEKSEQPLKKVLRLASEKDLETNTGNRSFADEAKAFCVEKVKTRELPMKIVSTETTLDKKRLIFYFTADGRIDFRELVRDLASRFKTRIEMRQIGVRDEVKLIGGIGSCGREACCRKFLTSFEPVSIRMAKKQELSINQSKLSGICGRLMCCLGYEYDEAAGRGARPKKAEKTPAEGEAAAGRPQKKAASKCPRKARPVPKDVTAGSSAGTSADKRSGGSEQVKPGLKPQDKADQKSSGKRKGKGKPFSKRRKFWKKKDS